VSNRVLITDGLLRKSLSAVRSLGKAGFHVSVMGDSLFTSSFWSRYTDQRIRAPLAATHTSSFGKTFLRTLASSPPLILLPMEDSTLTWVAEHLSLLDHYKCRYLIPPLESLKIAQDKGLTLALAEKLGLECPRTWKPATTEEFIRQLTLIDPYDQIVKPRKGTGSSGFSYVGQKTPAEWRHHWRKFGPLLIQERIARHGNAYGVSVLMDQEGQCVASFAHKRRYQYPLSGGPSTDRQSVHIPDLVNESIHLLKHLNWRGVAMVEWKTDPRDGKPKLMEINPRFWGSLELAVRSGVDFPTLYARAARGDKLGPPPPYPANIHCRWFFPGEILRYLKQSKMEREPLRIFFKGFPKATEEWDPADVDGFISTVICTGARAISSRYWRSPQADQPVDFESIVDSADWMDTPELPELAPIRGPFDPRPSQTPP
jgi:predicted ATP-grasp superfamily ATP-dependent carboligase